MSKRISILLCTLVCGLAGCANFNSVYRDLKTNEGTGALIDIKQRAIISSKSNDSTNPKVIVCAEPSPDALSAYAAEIAAKADLPSGVSAQLSSAFQESSSFTGLRTQSIQLLRDSMFRICEAHMNGAITAGQYDILARRYQKHTVALLAIEQLTGAIKAPAITLNTSGAAEAARSISEMRTEMSSIDKKLSDLEKKKGDSTTTDEDKKLIVEQMNLLKSDKELISKGIENARGTVVSGSATSNISALGLPTQRSDQHVQAVAASVEKIVMAIINSDDTGQLCFLQLAIDAKQLSEGGKKLQEYCSQALVFDQAASKLQLEALQESLATLKTSGGDASKNAAEAKKIAEQAERIGGKTRVFTVNPNALSE